MLQRVLRRVIRHANPDLLKYYLLKPTCRTKLTGHKLIRDVGILGKRYPLVDAVAAGIFDASVPAVNLLDRAISTAQMWAPKAAKRTAMSLIKKELHSDLVTALHSEINPDLFPTTKAKL